MGVIEGICGSTRLIVLGASNARQRLAANARDASFRGLFLECREGCGFGRLCEAGRARRLMRVPAEARGRRRNSFRPARERPRKFRPVLMRGGLEFPASED